MDLVRRTVADLPVAAQPGVSHTTLANVNAVPLGYSPMAPGLGLDGAPQGGGHRDLVPGQPSQAAVVLARPERIEVRRPWWDIRYVLRDWNGMGSLDNFDRASRRLGTVRADNNRASMVTALPFETSPVIERGTVASWDEGTAVKAHAGAWW